MAPESRRWWLRGRNHRPQQDNPVEQLSQWRDWRQDTAEFPALDRSADPRFDTTEFPRHEQLPGARASTDEELEPAAATRRRRPGTGLLVGTGLARRGAGAQWAQCHRRRTGAQPARLEQLRRPAREFDERVGIRRRRVVCRQVRCRWVVCRWVVCRWVGRGFGTCRRLGRVGHVDDPVAWIVRRGRSGWRARAGRRGARRRCRCSCRSGVGRSGRDGAGSRVLERQGTRTEGPARRQRSGSAVRCPGSVVGCPGRPRRGGTGRAELSRATAAPDRSRLRGE